MEKYKLFEQRKEIITNELKFLDLFRYSAVPSAHSLNKWNIYDAYLSKVGYIKLAHDRLSGYEGCNLRINSENIKMGRERKIGENDTNFEFSIPSDNLFDDSFLYLKIDIGKQPKLELTKDNLMVQVDSNNSGILTFSFFTETENNKFFECGEVEQDVETNSFQYNYNIQYCPKNKQKSQKAEDEIPYTNGVELSFSGLSNVSKVGIVEWSKNNFLGYCSQVIPDSSECKLAASAISRVGDVIRKSLPFKEDIFTIMFGNDPALKALEVFKTGLSEKSTVLLKKR